MLRGTFNGREVCIQVERQAVAYRLTHGGSQDDVLVLSPTAARLNEMMPVKEPANTAKLLLSPMPGLLVTVAVEAGQEVKSGDTLAVIEAMKMENVLRAEKDLVVAAVNALAGATLAVDEVIMEFE